MGRSRYVAGHGSLVVMMSVACLTFAGTFGADALDHIVDGFGLEAVGQRNGRDGNILKAEGAVADLAVKVHVAVIIDITVSVAEFISDPFTAVIDLVEQMVVAEEGKGAEYAGLVYGVNLVLKLGHSDGVMAVSQRLKYQQTVRCGLDTVLIQNTFQILHISCEVTQKR